MTATTPVRPFSKGLFIGIAFLTTIVVALATFTAVKALNATPPSSLYDLTAAGSRKSLSFSMPTLDGKNWTAAEHAGHVVVLNYFATWCPPCQAEFPDLVRLHGTYAPRGVDFAAIAIDHEDDPAGPRSPIVSRFAAERGISFPVLLPPLDSQLLREDMPIPQTLLLDRQGRVALHVTGRIEPAALQGALEKLLKE